MTQDPTKHLATAIESAREIVEGLRAMDALDDAELIADMIEGGSDLMEILDRLYEGEDDDKIIINGIKARESELAGRRVAAEKRIESRRAVMERALEACGLDKIKRPTFTAFLSQLPPVATVTNEADLPSRFFETKTVAILDKKSLLAALKDQKAQLDAIYAIESQAEREAQHAAYMAAKIEGAELTEKACSLRIRAGA
jgi:hypothetical protein